METILQHLDSLSCAVELARVDYRSESTKWRCSIAKNNGEVLIEAKTEGPAPFAVLSKTYNTFLKTMNSGVDFAGLIEAPQEPVIGDDFFPKPNDDDLPAF